MRATATGNARSPTVDSRVRPTISDEDEAIQNCSHVVVVMMGVVVVVFVLTIRSCNPQWSGFTLFLCFALYSAI